MQVFICELTINYSQDKRHIWFLSNSVSFDYHEPFCHLHSDAPKATLYILLNSQAMLLRYDRLIPNRAKKWKFLHNTRACRQSNSRHGGSKLESFQDFFSECVVKPCEHKVEISIFLINNVTVRLTKIMNRVDKNWEYV